jgi:hypothetical protein
MTLCMQRWLAAVVMAGVGISVGCDQLTGPSQDAINQTASAAPSSSPGSLLGHWIAGDGATASQGNVDQWLKEGVAETSFRMQFLDNNRLVVHPGSGENAGGTWQVVGNDGQKMMVRLASAALDATTPTDYQVVFLDQNRFTLTATDQTALAFTFTRLR